MRGPIFVFHRSEHERQALARDLGQVSLSVQTFDSPSALTSASALETPAVVLWDLDSGRVRGGIARLAARLRSPVVGLTSERGRAKEDDAPHTLLLPFERWRVTPVVLRLLDTLPAVVADVDDGSIFASMRVVADTIRQRVTDFIDPTVMEPPPLPRSAVNKRPRSTKAKRPATHAAARPVPTPEIVAPNPERAPERAPARSRRAPRVPTPVAPAAPRQVRVLIADDDEVLQHILGYQLEAQQWEVVKTGDGDVAHRLLTAGGIDVVLLDLNLPHRNGFELLEALAESPDGAPRLQVIVMSEQIQEEKIVRAFDLGAQDFVQKPFNPRVVVSRIVRLLKAG